MIWCVKSINKEWSNSKFETTSSISWMLQKNIEWIELHDDKLHDDRSNCENDRKANFSVAFDIADVAFCAAHNFCFFDDFVQSIHRVNRRIDRKSIIRKVAVKKNIIDWSNTRQSNIALISRVIFATEFQHHFKYREILTLVNSDCERQRQRKLCSTTHDVINHSLMKLMRKWHRKRIVKINIDEIDVIVHLHECNRKHDDKWVTHVLISDQIVQNFHDVVDQILIRLLISCQHHSRFSR